MAVSVVWLVAHHTYSLTPMLKNIVCFYYSMFFGRCQGDAALEQAMAATIYEKPRSHCFGTGQITEQHVMAAIGG